MTDDPRCCGSGTCIIDAAGRCWCGQEWDGQRMRAAPVPTTANAAPTATHADAPSPEVPDA